MASTANYNDKNADVYTPGAGASASNAVFAAHVDTAAAPHATPGAPVHGQAGYVVVYAQPTYVVIPAQVLETTADWKIDFCGCCGTPVHCCLAFCFPCVNAGWAADGIGRPGVIVGVTFFALYAGSIAFSSRQSYTSNSVYDSRYNSYDDTSVSFTVWTTLSLVCALLFVAATAVLRGTVRTFDGIPGSAITDVCASFWCSCCVLSQLSAHTERVKPLRNANVTTLPAYSAA